MKIILIKDVEKLGAAGSAITVKDGYARNYLLPNNLAVMATKGNLAKVEAIKKQAEAEKLALENKYNAVVQQINDLDTITFLRKADENDHLFGSVTEHDIAKALNEKNIDIQRSFIKLEKHLKELGDFEVEIEFSFDIKTKVKVKIEKEQ
jgi:large subunit ribosomal protein L9